MYLYENEEGPFIMFYGEAGYYASNILNGLKPHYRITFLQAPLLSNVISAEILVLSDDGRTANKYPLSIFNGRVGFPAWMAGRTNGIFAARFSDGPVITYYLWKSMCIDQSRLQKKRLHTKLKVITWLK